MKSGLVVFSRIAFSTLSIGSPWFLQFDPDGGMPSPVLMVAVDEPVRSTRLIFTVAQEAADSAAAAIQSAIQSVGGATDSSFPTQSMVFGLMAPTLPQFYDAWSVDMHEPGGSTQTSDHGFTFREPQKGTKSVRIRFLHH